MQTTSGWLQITVNWQQFLGEGISASILLLRGLALLRKIHVSWWGLSNIWLLIGWRLYGHRIDGNVSVMIRNISHKVDFEVNKCTFISKDCMFVLITLSNSSWWFGFLAISVHLWHIMPWLKWSLINPKYLKTKRYLKYPGSLWLIMYKHIPRQGPVLRTTFRFLVVTSSQRIFLPRALITC